MSDEQLWLHHYAIFTRATCVRTTLIPRPPSREFLERGPPARLRKAFGEFEKRSESSRAEAGHLA
eukprot:6322012-Pyramimonas_sp.AAC.1